MAAAVALCPSVECKATFVRLHGSLSRLGYTGWRGVSEDDVFGGCPRLYADFMRFIFTSFSSATASLMRKYDWFVIEGNDVTLGQSVVRLLAEEYQYTALLTGATFARHHFALHKMNMCLALIRGLAETSRQQASKAAARPNRSLPRYLRLVGQSQSAYALSRVGHASSSDPAALLLARRRHEVSQIPRSS